MKPYYVYIILCKNGALYVGQTNNSFRRIIQHYKEGRSSSMYIRACGFVQMIYQEEVKNRKEAIKREYEIQKMSYNEKWELVKNQPEPMKETVNYINNNVLRKIEV